MTTVVAAINREHGTAFSLVGRFKGGEGQGASELADPDGTAAVLELGAGTHAQFTRAARTTAGLAAGRLPGARDTVGR